MNDDLRKKGERYAAARGLVLAKPIDSGLHGAVWLARCNLRPSVIKVHSFRSAYLRECDVYQRLRQFEMIDVCGFNVPQFLGNDDELLVIEMSVVRRPFVLDFAAASLDSTSAFSPETIERIMNEAREEHGADWPVVQEVLNELIEIGVYHLDPFPRNIAVWQAHGEAEESTGGA